MPVVVRACALAAALLLSFGVTGRAQTSAPAKIPVRSAADLPRYTYPLAGTATALVHADAAAFDAFAQRVRSDLENTLATYDVQDHATLRDLLGVDLELQVLAGEDDTARATLLRIRSLEDKPDQKLLSGMRTEALLDARREAGADSGDAVLTAFARDYRAKLAPLPWPVVGTALKEQRAGLQLLGPALVDGRLAASVEPVVARSHAVSNDVANVLINARFALVVVLPIKDPALAALSAVVAAHNVQKPDIWAARDSDLSGRHGLSPVRVGIWDSGTDVALFPRQLFTDPRPTLYDAHGLAFDLLSYRTHGPLYPLTPDERRAYPEMRRYLKGFSDLQLAIDSPDADAVRRKISSLAPAEAPAFFERLGLFGTYVHGTHVAGIAVRGNPAARIVVGRITFDHKTVPTPPSDELEHRSAQANRAYVDYFRAHGVRVVNMSWGGTPADDEEALEKNGIGKDAAERKRLAAHYFAIDRAGLQAAIASAPDILFICSAGNANSDSTFEETIPAALRLPNLIAVGAVDQAGDETSFTSYGPTVVVDADGYQVDSTIPGGTRLRLSGTSMSSPNVTNLAAKLFALDSHLRPADVIRLIRAGATTTPDGRRHLVDPKRSIALLEREMPK